MTGPGDDDTLPGPAATPGEAPSRRATAADLRAMLLEARAILLATGQGRYVPRAPAPAKPRASARAISRSRDGGAKPKGTTQTRASPAAVERERAAKLEGLASRKAAMVRVGYVCRVGGCGHPAVLGGLCKGHLAHQRTHGDPVKPSLRTPAVNPRARAAWAFLATHAAEPAVAGALGLADAYLRTFTRYAMNPREFVTRPAREKADAAWCRLGHHRAADPRGVLAVLLGTRLALDADEPWASPDRRLTQLGKAVMRLAGGRVWRLPGESREVIHQERDAMGRPARIAETVTTPGRVLARSFFRSEGRVLRVLGADAEAVMAPLTASRWSDLRAFASSFAPLPDHTRRVVPTRAAVRNKRAGNP